MFIITFFMLHILCSGGEFNLYGGGLYVVDSKGLNGTTLIGSQFSNNQLGFTSENPRFTTEFHGAGAYFFDSTVSLSRCAIGGNLIAPPGPKAQTQDLAFQAYGGGIHATSRSIITVSGWYEESERERVVRAW